ncbi:MAG: hypothetical protein E6K18_00940 [Methanobacteriota archaeon]|nr:MAG: hypothetical protein E6K18_00940 [Euryarchaeota archaeon]
MEPVDRDRRERLILNALMERRVAVEEETKRLRAELTELVRREAELREEILSLDQILGALPQPVKENEAPSLFTPAPAPVPAPSAPPATKKRRRKGSRREQMLPKLRAKFGTGVFGVEAVTDLLLQEEPGERRKAYFAAWSLCRDLAEDAILVAVSEEGSGRRVKRTYKFADAAPA